MILLFKMIGVFELIAKSTFLNIVHTCVVALENPKLKAKEIQ